MDVGDAATTGGASAAVGGFLFYVFRFLVGASVADISSDVKVLKIQMLALQTSIEAKDAKLDHLLLALAEK